MNKENTLIVCDLDGTLLKSDKTISQGTINYFKYLLDNKVNIILASGRPYISVKTYYKQLGLKQEVVCFNGSLIVDPYKNDKIVFQQRFPKELLIKLIDQFGEDNFDNMLFEYLDSAIEMKDKNTFYEMEYRKENKIKFGNIEENLTEDPLSALFVVKKPEDKAKLLKLGSSLDKNINIRFWDGCLIAEMYFNSVNKYTSLSLIAKKLKLKNENIICIGDADNDVEMIYRSGIGVAMKNSTSNLIRQTCDMLSIDDNDHDGVRKTLQLLIQ